MSTVKFNLGVDFQARPMEQSDRAFVASTWLRDLRERSPYYRKIHPQDYNAIQTLTIDSLLDRCRTLIACDIKNPNVIYGFMTYGPMGLIHYTYTKKAFRRLGIYSSLKTLTGIEGIPTFTYMTSCLEDVCRQSGQDYRFNPYALYAVLK